AAAGPDARVAFIGQSMPLADEIYQIRDFDAGASHVLLRLDPTSVDLTRDNVHRHPYGWPLAWTRAYGKGRVFYTALGHEEQVWRDARVQTLMHNAVLWTIGGVPEGARGPPTIATWGGGPLGPPLFPPRR